MTTSETTHIARIVKIAATLSPEARTSIVTRLRQGLSDEDVKAAVEIEKRYVALSPHGREYAVASISDAMPIG